jgi:ATP-binding cassette subfamily C protein LapB
LESIKAANAEMETEGRLREMEADCARVDLKMRRVNLLGNSMTVLCMNLTTLGVLVGCVHQILELEMTMGAMIACTMVAGRAMAPLMGMAGLLLRFQQTMTSLKSLMGIMQMPREDERPLLRLPLRHPSFRLDQVTLTYAGQPIPSLRQVSLQIKAGERVGVIGRAGSGKTTLLRLLGRLLLPSEGLLLVEGVDVRQVHPAQIRQVCGYLPQDPVLFHGTVRENILLGRSNGVSDETFTRAAARAGLLEWVNRHPNGFDLQVGERGILLSGGQRQAVAAARVMLTEPDVLFMDEPAANFDITSEKQFREALGDYLSEDPRRTLVLATHKMSLLSLVDRLIVLEMGQVVADGPRELVLAKLQGKGLPDKSEGGKEEAI